MAYPVRWFSRAPIWLTMMGLIAGVCGFGVAGLGVAQQQPIPAGAVQVSDGRFTFVSMPSDAGLARNLLAYAIASDSFPGLPRPAQRATIFIAPDAAKFREWIGPGPPEWGAAVAFPDERRIVMQGHAADSRAGNPQATLRHELAHLSLHENAGSLPPRWFDEGYASYAAREWGRDDVLASNVALFLRGVPRFATLDTLLSGGSASAEEGYALAHRAVADIAALDPRRGLTLLFRYWRESQSLDVAMRQAYGVTLGGFEDGWRSTTRRRYGALSIFADVGFATLVLFAFVAPFWVLRRRRDRTRLAAMVAADEMAERRERESAIAALLAEGSPEDR